MSGLAEDHLEPPSLRRRMLVIAAVVLAVIAVGSLAWWLKSQLSAPSAAKRQVARITILPDTPPPPPPPPPLKAEPKPPPRDDNKPPPPDLAPKPLQAPVAANEPIKMEGPAGSGDSPFAAGAVNNDYKGGPPTVGASAPGAGSVVDRAQERFYAQSARQLLQGEIERTLRSETTELVVSFSLWVDRAGAIQQVQLQPSGSPQDDAALQATLDDARRAFKLPQPPAGLTQPLRFRLTVRPQG